MLLLTKSKGHRSNSHYSGVPNYLQTKSNLHISICQSQIHQVKTRWEALYRSKTFLGLSKLIWTEQNFLDMVQNANIVVKSCFWSAPKPYRSKKINNLDQSKIVLDLLKDKALNSTKNQQGFQAAKDDWAFRSLVNRTLFEHTT